MDDWSAFRTGILFQLAAIDFIAASQLSSRVRRTAALGAVFCFFACQCFFFRSYTVDDANISLRYADNFRHGLGLTFSAGDSPPVEGFTNFLWVLCESALFVPTWGTGAILACVKAAGILFGLLVLVSRTEWMPGNRYEMPAAAMLFVLAGAALEALLRQASQGNSGAFAGGALLVLATLSLTWSGPALHENVNYTSRLRVAHEAIGKWIRAFGPRPVSIAGFDLGALSFYAQAEKVVEANPLGLLSAETTHHGCDPDRLMDARPDFFALQQASGNAMEKFYASPRFQSEYLRMFTFYFSHGLLLDVFARKELELARPAMEEGERLARFSKESL